MLSKRDDDKEADITSVYQAMMAAQIYAQNSSISAQSEVRQTNHHMAVSHQQLSQHQPQSGRDASSHLQAIHTPPVVHACNNNATNASQDRNLRLIQHTMQQQMQQLAEMRARERWGQQLMPQPQQIGGQIFNFNATASMNTHLDQMRERAMNLSQQHEQLKATHDRLQQEINYKMLLESQQRNTSSANQQQQTQLMIKAQKYNTNRNVSSFDNNIPISTALNSLVEQQQQYQHGYSIQSQHKMKHNKQPQQQQLHGINGDTDGASDIQCSSFDNAPPVATALNSSIVDQQIQQQKILGKKSSTVQDSKDIKVRVKVNNKTCTEGVTVAVKGSKRNTKKMAVAKKTEGRKMEETESADSSDASDEETLDKIQEGTNNNVQLVTFHCRKCNEDCSFPANRSASGKFAMHVRYCKGKKNTQVVKESPKKKSSPPQKAQQVTFHCKFCNKSFTYNARTGAASFTHHTRSCDPNQIAIGKGKKRKKSPEEKKNKTPTVNETTKPTPKKSKLSQEIRAESSYPYAPLGNLWLDKSLSSQSIGDTIVGRRLVWDEGYFVDGHINPQPQITYDEQNQTQKLKGGQCNCGSNHLTNLLNTLIEDTQPNDDKESSIGRSSRRREKSSTASSSSTISSQLAGGRLDPHVSHLLIFVKYIVYFLFSTSLSFDRH